MFLTTFELCKEGIGGCCLPSGGTVGSLTTFKEAKTFSRHSEGEGIWKGENYNYRTRNNALRNYKIPNIDFIKITFEILTLCYTWHLRSCIQSYTLRYMYFAPCDPFALLFLIHLPFFLPFRRDAWAWASHAGRRWLPKPGHMTSHVGLGWLAGRWGWIRMFIRMSDFLSFFFDYGQIRYRIYYVNS